MSADSQQSKPLRADSPWMPLFVGGAFISTLAFNAVFLLGLQRGHFVSLELGLMGLSLLLIGLEFILDPARVIRVTRHGMGGETSPVPLGWVFATIGTGLIGFALVRTALVVAF